MLVEACREMGADDEPCLVMLAPEEPGRVTEFCLVTGAEGMLWPLELCLVRLMKFVMGLYRAEPCF